MNKIKKILTLFALFGFLFISINTVSAATNDGQITVTPPDNTASTSKNTYTLYKVFDAETDGTNYSYKLKSNHTTVPYGFVKDDAGNIYFADIVTEGGEGTFVVKINGVDKILKNKSTLDDNAITVIKEYVNDSDIVSTIEVEGTDPAVFSSLSYGYYYVSTTTGTLVVIDSTKPAVNVKDKNEVPTLDKKITKADSIVDETGKQAIAQVGKNVEYTLTVTKKKGAENYIVYDNLGTGLIYNKDVKVFVGDTEVSSTNYTKTETDNSLVLKLNNSYISGLQDGTVITIKYTALVTEDSLHTNPAKNTAWLEYGHNPGDNKTPVVETKTYNATFSVTKKDDKDAALAGAGFVLKDASGKYYKYTAATETAPEKIEWVTSINDATEYASQATDGKLNGQFTGLCNGTYTLVEKTVPKGFNQASDYTFTIAEKNVTTTNLIQSTEVINNKGSELPSTGGIGTTVFHITGAALAIGAAVLLISKKRMNNN